MHVAHFVPTMQVSVCGEDRPSHCNAEDATVHVLSKMSAIFISFWHDASSSWPCSNPAMALFSDVGSDGSLAVYSSAVSRHFVTRWSKVVAKTNTWKQTCNEGGREGSIYIVFVPLIIVVRMFRTFNFRTRPSVWKYFNAKNFPNYGNLNMLWNSIEHTHCI